MLLALALLIPSLDIVGKYLGLAGVVVYLVVGLAGLGMVRRFLPALDAGISPRHARWALAAAVALLFALWAVVYPLAKSGRYGGGSDRDDALNQAVHALLKGENPYSAHTYLGNPLSPLPGAMVLAMPFVAAGNSAYQNLFWILVLVVTAYGHLRSAVGTLAYFVVGFFACAAPLLELMTGGDQLTTSIYVLCATLGLLSCVATERALSWKQAGLSVLLGVGLSSRAHYDVALALALPCALWVAAPSFRRLVPVLLLVGVTSLGLDLGFYLLDPELFRRGPLQAVDKLSGLPGGVPHPELWIPLLSLVAPPVVWWRSSLEPRARLLASYSAGLACAVVPMVALKALEQRRLGFDDASYGVAFQLPLLLLWVEGSLDRSRSELRGVLPRERTAT